MQIIKGIQNRLRIRFWRIYRIYLTLAHYKKKKWLITRKGQCNKCGACCVGCKLWNPETKLCNDFELAKKIECDLFPICPLDQKRLGVENVCGYYWEKK